MENASKALIIAGAILIAIVLITLGVVILQQGDSMTDTGETALNAREIETFNSQFTKYAGTNVSGTNVKALINAIKASNAAQIKSGGNHQISLPKDDKSKIVTANYYDSGKRYTVDFVYGNNGYIVSVNIE